MSASRTETEAPSGARGAGARPRIAVLVSGTGRHLENLARLAEAGELDVEIALAIADRPGIAAIERAERHSVPCELIDPERALAPPEFGERVFGAVEAAGCELVVLAGFLRKLDLPAAWEGRVLNIHPSLLPAFGGKGFWGSHVHRAVLERGCRVSGCTVHYVDDEYDHGPIIEQLAVRVDEQDDPSSLAARVFEAELEALPSAIRRHFEKAGRTL